MADKKAAPAIGKLTSAVFDNGRRGNPRPGCDCVQCFGYCLIDENKAIRDTAARADRIAVQPGGIAELRWAE